jgi:hypothetical protein
MALPAGCHTEVLETGFALRSRPSLVRGDRYRGRQDTSARSALASFRSAASNRSVNQVCRVKLGRRGVLCASSARTVASGVQPDPTTRRLTGRNNWVRWHGLGRVVVQPGLITHI